MWISKLVIFISCSVVVCLAGYEIPEPTIEAYSPRGLRVAILDSSGIESFSFHGNLQHPLRKFDRGDLSSTITTNDNSYWIYWNSDVLVKPGDVLYYRLIVKKDGQEYRRDNGRHVIDKVITLPDTLPPPLPDCDQGQVVDQTVLHAGFEDDLNKLREMTFGAGQELSYGGAGEHRKSYESSSSYSTHQTSNLKPIVRKTSSTVEGTYFIKPTGVEGSGVQTSSVFDSTKPEGAQWQHFKKDLTAEDLAKHPNLKELTGLTTFNKGEIIGQKPFGRQEYHQSYYQQEVNSQHGTEQRPVQIQHSYYQQASSAPQHPRPQYFQTSYYKESAVQKNQGAAPTLQNLNQGSYFREANVHHVPATPVVAAQTHQSSYYKESSSVQNKGGVGSAGRYVSVPAVTITTPRPEFEEQRRYEYEDTYRGTVFDVRSGTGRTPTECKRYDIDVRTNQELTQELGEVKCLAGLVENVLRSEINDVRRQYEELERRFRTLERLTENCECIDRNS